MKLSGLSKLKRNPKPKPYCVNTFARRYGSYLLDAEHWPRVFACVEALEAALTVPVTAKIRLLPTLEETLAFASGLQVCIKEYISD